MILHYTEKVDQGILYLTDDELRHCVKALRKKVGDEINVFDEFGNIYAGVIKQIDRQELKATVIGVQKAAPILTQITMVVAPTKNPDRIEWMIGKAVEIGVQQIILMHTDRTERTRHKMDRIKKIAFSSAKQSLNLILPNIIEVDSVKETLDLISDYNAKYIAHCLDPKDHLMLKKIHNKEKIAFLIGPEGDFTENEITMLMSHGFEEISLGPSRLRTETAGIVALTLINGMLQCQ